MNYEHFDIIVESVKNKKPGFRSGLRGKAHYSNSNYKLLATILE